MTVTASANTPTPRRTFARASSLKRTTFAAMNVLLSTGHATGVVVSRRCEICGYRPAGRAAGGIIIPDSAKEKPSQGEITAVGPGGRDEAGKLIPIDLKVGDRVLFGKWSGTEVKLDGQELLIMKESDIMGVLTDVPATKKKAA